MNIVQLKPFDPQSGDLNVVIETPKGSRNKFAYDLELELYKLKGTLPLGASFPYDFGFVPSTLGSDGDPIDVMLLMEVPAFTGCLVEARLIGVIEVEQTEEGNTERNDRLIAVYPKSPLYEEVHTLDDLGQGMIHQIEHFFHSYNEVKGHEFRVLARQGVDRAVELIREGEKLFKQKGMKGSS
jgi:inorganic pyrophosphatase